jgi:UDP-glucose 4-epimerase
LVSKVLITGAGGYIGGRLVDTFLTGGWEVATVVREPAPRLRIKQTVCDLAEAGTDLLAAASEGAETIVHLAGEDELVGAREPAKALSATVVATERIAEACASAGVKRLVYLSTVHVYGARMTPGAMLTEELRVEPRSAYAISRLASEHVAAALAGSAYEVVILRLTNAVGAPDDPTVDRWSLVANDLCRQGAVQGRLELRSSGTQWRDFVALSAVCDGIAGASRAHDPIVPPGTYNVGSGHSITVRGLAEMIQDEFERHTGKRPELRAPDAEADPLGPYRVCVERAARHGLRFDSPLADAVSETVRFCLEHREELV